MYHYSLEDVNNIISEKGILPLPLSIQTILKELEDSLNVPAIVEQLQLQQQQFFKEKNMKNSSNYILPSNYNKNKNKHSIKDERTNSLSLNTIISTNNDKWMRNTEAVEKFKITKIEKKEGIEKTLNEIRTSLNKISQKNYETQKDKIIELIETMLNKVGEEIDDELEEDGIKREMKDDEKIINLHKISQFVFDIASSNKFFCELYANLYKELINKYETFTITLQSFVDNFKNSIQHFCYCDPNEDYERYCLFVKESDKKKATTAFIIMLLDRGVLNNETIIEIIEFFKNVILSHIDTENRINEAEELTEIFYIMVSLGKNTLQKQPNEKWENIIKSVKIFTEMNVKQHKSMTSRMLFKIQDLFRLLNI